MTKEQAYGVDISNFAGEIAPAMAQSLAAAGARWCVVGYQFPELFERQVRALAGAGIKVAAYFFIYWSRGLAEESVRLGKVLDHLQQIESSGLLFGWPRPDGTDMPKLWLDFEEDTTGLPRHLAPAETVDWGHQLVSKVQVNHLSTGVYTGEYWWKQNAGNSTAFHDLPLWHASQFTETIPVPFAQYYEGHAYGGWPVPMAWQYRGTDDVGGVSCDQNLEEWEAGVQPVPPPAKATLTLTEVDGRQRVFREE